MASQRDKTFKQKGNYCIQHTILQKFTNFHEIRSWSFQNICNETRWPRFFGPPCISKSWKPMPRPWFQVYRDYKLSRCICPSNYNRFWDTAIYWSKIVNFSYPLAFVELRRVALFQREWNSATPAWCFRFSLRYRLKFDEVTTSIRIVCLVTIVSVLPVTPSGDCWSNSVS